VDIVWRVATRFSSKVARDSRHETILQKYAYEIQGRLMEWVLESPKNLGTA